MKSGTNKDAYQGNIYLEGADIDIKDFKAFGDLGDCPTCEDADVAILEGNRFEEFKKLIAADQRIDLALVVVDGGEKTIVFLNDQFDYDLLGNNFHPHCGKEEFHSLLKGGPIQPPDEGLPTEKHEVLETCAGPDTSKWGTSFCPYCEASSVGEEFACGTTLGGVPEDRTGECFEREEDNKSRKPPFENQSHDLRSF